MSRRPLGFDCEGRALCGIVDCPDTGAATLGVLVITGGPQYRVGSHRQFAQLGRSLAAAGFACLRFDHRGSGDSDGEPVAFDALDADVQAAVDAFFDAEPELERVVIWGLCDAASAALLYAPGDERVAGLVLLNPWVRRESSQAQTELDAWYRARLTDVEFWRRLLSGRVNVFRSLRDFVRSLVRARRSQGVDEGDYVDRMAAAMQRFEGRILLILSGEDLTAREFSLVAESEPWKSSLGHARVRRIDMPGANHTFSSPEWKRQVERETIAWLRDQR